VTHHLWISERGWQASDGRAGTWAEEAWTSLPELLAGFPAGEPRRLVPAPDRLVTLKLPYREGMTPMAVAREQLCLAPGRWAFQSALAGETLFLVCYPTELEPLLERVAAEDPKDTTISLLPLCSETLAGLAKPLRIGGQTIWCAFDGTGVLEQWHWLPEDQMEAFGVAAVDVETVFAEEVRWLDYQGAPVRQFAGLVQRQQQLLVALLVLLLVAAGCWLGRHWVEAGYAARDSVASRFLTENRLDEAAIQERTESGELISRELREIQEFSNRDHPMANRIAALANLGNAKTTWLELEMEVDRFRLVLAAERWPDILDAVAEIRTLSWVRDLRTDDLDTRSRGGRVTARIEGRLE